MRPHAAEADTLRAKGAKLEEIITELKSKYDQVVGELRGRVTELEDQVKFFRNNITHLPISVVVESWHDDDTIIQRNDYAGRFDEFYDACRRKSGHRSKGWLPLSRWFSIWNRTSLRESRQLAVSDSMVFLIRICTSSRMSQELIDIHSTFSGAAFHFGGVLWLTCSSLSLCLFSAVFTRLSCGLAGKNNRQRENFCRLSMFAVSKSGRQFVGQQETAHEDKWGFDSAAETHGNSCWEESKGRERGDLSDLLLHSFLASCFGGMQASMKWQHQCEEKCFTEMMLSG